MVVHKTDEGALELVHGQSADIEREWRSWDPGIPLCVLETDYASVVAPIVDFIEERRCEGTQITVLIPVILPSRLRYRLLHNQIDHLLSRALRGHDDVVVARVPFALDHFAARDLERAAHGQPASRMKN